MPVVFVPHGGGPWPFVEIGFPKDDVKRLADYLRSVSSIPPVPPKTLLVGSPVLASLVRALLDAAGVVSEADGERGYDHGTFIPLKLTYPNADVPAVQLSLKRGLDPAEHLAIGRALAPLRDEGVFIIGSGMTFHNLRAFRDPRAVPVAEAFDSWLREAMVQESAERSRRLEQWASAPAARAAHPREEHLLPLMVATGAAGDDRAVVGFNGTFGGLRLSSYHFGVTP
jgi:aromatic ring-opening dioxygenase catalytic subunit (LigB family)